VISPDEEITRLKAALVSLETQRATLGDTAVDLSLKAVKEQISALESEASKVPQSAGERRQATILFSDLSGYTSMNEKLAPEEVLELMKKIKAEAIRIVEDCGGSVNQFVGDEVVALFGIPNAHEDDPVRAVNAALALHRVVNSLSKEVEPLIGEPLTMHSGINTGLIITATWDARDGKIGLTGDTVNTGARLQSKADKDEILVSPHTQILISPFFKTEALQPVKMKGKAESMIPYRILGKTEIETRIEASRQRGFTKLIGRDEELATLNACLNKAIQGKGQIVTVCGAAGLGKSRLIYEFLQSLDGDKITVLEGRCQSHGISTPYFPFLDAMRRDLQLGEEDAPGVLHEKVVTALRSMDTDLEQHLPALLHLLSIPTEQYSLNKELSGEKLKQAIQEALVVLNTMNKKQMTKVWVLEDWHWSDEASDATLMKHLEVISSLQLMVVVLYRPEYIPRWKQNPCMSTIQLNSVSEESVRSMIQSIYGVKDIPPEFITHIFRHSGGNPFFIEELCDLFSKEETVLVEDGRISLQRPIAQITFPESVQAVIRSKLDLLYAESKEVLGLASVIGREFLVPILEHITARAKDLSSSLANLQDSELIREIEHVPEKTYQFNHVITQEVTYQTLLKKQRLLLHHLVGETIELLYAERLEEQFEMLAYHYSKSSDLKQALHYLELAGDKATTKLSLVEARTYYKEAMGLIESNAAEQGTAWRSKYVDISLKWAEISHFSGPEEFISILKISMAHAKSLNDAPKIAQLSYWFGQKAVITGSLKKAIDHFTESIEVAKRCNEHALLAQTYSAIGRVYVFDVNYAKANENLKKAMDLNEEIGEMIEMAGAASVLGQSLSCTGDFEKAMAYSEQAVEIVEKTEHLSRKAVSYMWLGCSHCLQGNWEEGIEASIQTNIIAQPLGDIIPFIVGTGFGGYAMCMHGDQQGLISLEKSASMIEKNQFFLLYPIIYGSLAYCYARANKSEDAIEAAQKCLEWSVKGWKGWDVLAYYALGIAETLKKTPDPAKADAAFLAGASLCKERGQNPNLAQGYLEYANTLYTLQNKDKSRHYVNLAIQLFTSMKMTWWLEQALELSRRLS